MFLFKILFHQKLRYSHVLQFKKFLYIRKLRLSPLRKVASTFINICWSWFFISSTC